MVYCSGLESQCPKPHKTAENAQICGSSDANCAPFTGCSDDSDGSEVGTLAARVEHHADAIIRYLPDEPRRILLAADPANITREDYAPFIGQSRGLFQVAPGWQRMELSPLGLEVRARLASYRAGEVGK